MDKSTLNAVLDWMRTTDLAEVAFHRAGEGFELASDQASAAPVGGFPDARVVPVPSPEVGVFRAAALGKSPKAQPGDEVAEGAVLGVIDTGAAKVDVKAPAAGKLIPAAAEDGKAVEYGQPLFFIQPR
ncbi:MAG: hypothetical protein HYZ75_02780 [Elusimicrobia bacterium]|nr:hypothetical protein [Elusimicrobiota bacterium]